MLKNEITYFEKSKFGFLDLNEQLNLLFHNKEIRKVNYQKKITEVHYVDYFSISKV